MHNKFSQIIKLIFWSSFTLIYVCGNTPPKKGLITEITSVTVFLTDIRDGNGIQSTLTEKNPIDIVQTLAQAQSMMFNYKGIIFDGSYSLEIRAYGCNKNSGSNYLVILNRDGIPFNTNFSYIYKSEFQTAQFRIEPAFDDPNLSLPESHVYTLEFWECNGECKQYEYDKKSDKKAELTINYSVVP